MPYFPLLSILDVCTSIIYIYTYSQYINIYTVYDIHATCIDNVCIYNVCVYIYTLYA